MTEAFRDLGGNIPNTDIPDQYYLCQVQMPAEGIAKPTIRRGWVHTPGFNLEPNKTRQQAEAENSIDAASWFKQRRESEGWGKDAQYSIIKIQHELPIGSEAANMPFGFRAVPPEPEQAPSPQPATESIAETRLKLAQLRRNKKYPKQ